MRVVCAGIGGGEYMRGRINLFNMTPEGLEELEKVIMDVDELMADIEKTLDKARECAYQLRLVASPHPEFDEE